MIKCNDGVVEFTGVDYKRAAQLGVPKDIAELAQAEVLVTDLAYIFEAMATKLGTEITIDMIELAITASLDPRYTKEDTE